MQTKPAIVFCHGSWADRAGFSMVIPPLRAKGHKVIGAQYGLATNEGDVDRSGVGAKTFANKIKRSEQILTTKENSHERAY